jgi:hypothetical protein
MNVPHDRGVRVVSPQHLLFGRVVLDERGGLDPSARSTDAEAGDAGEGVDHVQVAHR